MAQLYRQTAKQCASGKSCYASRHNHSPVSGSNSLSPPLGLSAHFPYYWGNSLFCIFQLWRCCSAILVFACKTTWCHHPENRNLNFAHDNYFRHNATIYSFPLSLHNMFQPPIIRCSYFAKTVILYWISVFHFTCIILDVIINHIML
jgi:hypothetical protein